jgi:uncharacterized protein
MASMCDLISKYFKNANSFNRQFKMNIILRASYLPNFLKRNIREFHFPKQSHSIASINFDRLTDSGIQGIIIDLDNTIISEDDRYVSPNAVTWIAQAKKLGFKLFILSNGKRHYRVRYWSEYLDVPAISPARKPFPAAFRKAMADMQLAPKRVVIIGDSFHTDLFGAWIVGCPSIQVASLPHPPRWWEKFIGKYVQTSYPIECELWEFQSSNYYKNN